MIYVGDLKKKEKSSFKVTMHRLRNGAQKIGRGERTGKQGRGTTRRKRPLGRKGQRRRRKRGEGGGGVGEGMVGRKRG